MAWSHMDGNGDWEGLNCSEHGRPVGVMWAMCLPGHFGQLTHMILAVTQLIAFALKMGGGETVEVIQICCWNLHYPRWIVSLAMIRSSPDLWHTKSCALHTRRISTDRFSTALRGIQPCLTKWRKKSKTLPDVVRPSDIHIAFCGPSCA